MAHSDTKVLTAHAPLPLVEKVDQKEERGRLTRNAMTDVKLGLVIDHGSVQAWADSLDTDNPLPAPMVR